MDTVASKDEAVPQLTRNTSFADPLPCNTNLLPAITSNEDPAGTVAF